MGHIFFYNQEIPRANGVKFETGQIVGPPSTLIHYKTRLLFTTRFETHTSHVVLLPLDESLGDFDWSYMDIYDLIITLIVLCNLT